ncbi:Protein priA [Termitomyces sp. T112]|nr:Protein priA [Termitomyces sp. T112]
MRVYRAVTVALTAVLSLSTVVIGNKSVVVRRDDLTVATDVCGDVDADFTVSINGKHVNLGHIKECLCLSSIPSYISTQSSAVASVALVGKDKTTQTLTDLVHNCPGQTCNYPSQAVPECQHGNPCGFTCKNGYIPYPAQKPTQCVCNPPYSVCNGKCGMFNGCPSGYLAKRDFPRGKRCPSGYTPCGIPARGANSWECLNIQTELESCGGCVLSLSGNVSDIPEGADCTAMPGVADVSCVGGRCLVHRCMPGYEFDPTGSSCVYLEDRDPVILAEQYGLEHVPF